MVESFGNVHEYSVSELAGAIKKSIEDGFQFVRVRGECGRVTRAASGHFYLDLKDDKAVLSAVIWRGAADRLRFQPEQGMEVVATGKLTTFPGQSRYQLVIDSLEPAGVGALMVLFEERKKKLAAEGLFSAARKKALPFLPEVIGVVTSPSGAVIRDILHRLRDRFPRHVIVWPTQVQGKGAELTIAAAIDGFNALSAGDEVPRPDVLIVARGGGSLEDLWCFNEEAVVRAAAASKIPLISAIGHETDTTLIDFAADWRAPTPSAAAEMAVPVRGELLSELLNKQRRLVKSTLRGAETRRAALLSAARALGKPEDILGPVAQRFDRASERLKLRARARFADAEARLDRAGGRLVKPALLAGLREREGRLHRFGDRLDAAAHRVLDRMRRNLDARRLSRSLLLRLHASRTAQLAAAGNLLQSLSHASVLQRGFALVKAEGGALIHRAAEAIPGAGVSLIFADGERSATIGGAAPNGGRKPGKPALQKSLFD